MAETLNDHIDKLRKRSRHLLAQVDKNSKNIKTEINKFYQTNLLLQESDENYISKQFSDNTRNTQSWMVRNNSSGISGVLCPDYFCNSPNPKRVSMPHTSAPKRILMSLKKKSENQCCSENIYRKPVRECYCYPEIKKIQLRSSRTQHKQYVPCKHCKSHVDVYPLTPKGSPVKPLLHSPISCETLKRVQNIDYSPKSQFLRNVQSKVSLLQEAATSDAPEICLRTQCHHEFFDNKDLRNVDSVQKLKTYTEEQHNVPLTKSRSLVNIDKNLECSEEQYSESDNVDKLDRERQTSSRKQSRPNLVIKRTLSSKKSVQDLKKTKSNPKIPIKNKRTSQALNKQCPCCNNNKVKHTYTIPTRKEMEKSSNDFHNTVYVNNKHKESDEEYVLEDEINELGRFREQNYFETHGSSHTLVSSKSSGSLEQYLLNERLFPEPVNKIHKKDLVITMPACATMQRRRMHYFPRYIVQQEKNSSNTNYKKKRCQGCPLTGHAIDLGITKLRPPLNSLALKYQKRLS